MENTQVNEIFENIDAINKISSRGSNFRRLLRRENQIKSDHANYTLKGLRPIIEAQGFINHDMPLLECIKEIAWNTDNPEIKTRLSECEKLLSIEKIDEGQRKILNASKSNLDLNEFENKVSAAIEEGLKNRESQYVSDYTFIIMNFENPDKPQIYLTEDQDLLNELAVDSRNMTLTLRLTEGIKTSDLKSHLISKTTTMAEAALTVEAGVKLQNHNLDRITEKEFFDKLKTLHKGENEYIFFKSEKQRTEKEKAAITAMREGFMHSLPDKSIVEKIDFILEHAHATYQFSDSNLLKSRINPAEARYDWTAIEAIENFKWEKESLQEKLSGKNLDIDFVETLQHFSERSAYSENNEFVINYYLKDIQESIITHDKTTGLSIVGEISKEFSNESLNYEDYIAGLYKRTLYSETAPWLHSGISCRQRAYNPKTGEVFKGLNSLVLEMSAAENGITDNRWLKEKEISELRFNILENAHPTILTYANGKNSNVLNGSNITQEKLYNFEQLAEYKDLKKANHVSTDILHHHSRISDPNKSMYTSQEKHINKPMISVTKYRIAQELNQHFTPHRTNKELREEVKPLSSKDIVYHLFKAEKEKEDYLLQLTGSKQRQERQTTMER